MSPPTIAAICLVLAVSGFIQGLSGFGFAIVAMAVLPWLTGDFQTSFTLVALNSLVIPGLIMLNTRKAFRFRPAMALAIGAVAGTFLGFHFMHRNVGGVVFIRVFGGVLILFAVADFILTRAFSYTMPKWMGWPCGVLGGFFGGAFNIGGPPMVAYAYSQPWSNQQTVATLQAAFVCATSYRIWLMGFNGYFDRSLLSLTAYTVLPTAVGIWLGVRSLDLVPRHTLKMAVFAVVGLLGVKYLVSPPRSPESVTPPPPATRAPAKTDSAGGNPPTTGAVAPGTARFFRETA